MGGCRPVGADEQRPGENDELKQTGSGTLFTVDGETAIEIRTVAADTPAGAPERVEIRTVAVYDPSTDEVLTCDAGHIAL